MKTTMIIKKDVVTFVEDSKAPKMILDNEKFFSGLNKVLATRYRDDALVKLQSSKNTLSSLEKTRNEKTDTMESEEYTALIEKINKTTIKIDKLSTLVNSLKSYIAEYVNIETPETINEIITMYSLLYSNVVGITDKNKTMTGTLKGMKDLYNDCKAYTNVFNNNENWDDSRKDAFNKIKNELIEIGSRLNGDSDQYRKGFKYSASSKDVNQIINYVSEYAKHNKNNGKIGNKRNGFKDFQEVVISTVFRIESSAVTSSSEVEI